MINIIIAPIHEGYFTGRNWYGLDVEELAGYLVESSKNIEVKVIPVKHILSELDYIPKDSYVFYTTSYDTLYTKYITDMVYHLSAIRPDIELVPNFDLLLSFENKGYQELLRRRLSIGNLRGYYFGDISDFPTDAFQKYPYVVKMIAGATSSNVFLARSYDELKAIVKKKVKNDFRFRLKKLLKRYVAKNKDIFKHDKLAVARYDGFFTKRVPFIIQEYIDGLNSDFRVTVFGDKFYPFRRFVRENDFRASGSGKHSFEEPPRAVLSFAKEVYEKLNVPFVSLDIAEKNGECYLIEFQGIGFGPSAVQKSRGYYSLSEVEGNEAWKFTPQEPSLERAYAEGLLYHTLKKKALI